MKTTDNSGTRATLEQVAELAGVSRTTASLVLSGKSDKLRISTDTVHRVQLAANQLDYSPNLLIRSLHEGRTNILAFYNTYRQRSENDIYMDRLTTALEHAVGQRGCSVLVYCDFRQNANNAYRFLNGGHNDGLILFAPLPNDPLLPFLRVSRLPTVLLNARDPEEVLHSVRDDVECGMQQIANALVQMGHRRIGILTEQGLSVRDAQTRIDLLRRNLALHGVSIPPDSIVPYEPGRTDHIQRLMRSDKPPTALFCSRDRLAYAAVEECEALAINVPGMLSIVGYDGLPWASATKHIVASVIPNVRELANQAVDNIMVRLAGSPPPQIDTTVQVHLELGTTLAPPRGV